MVMAHGVNVGHFRPSVPVRRGVHGNSGFSKCNRIGGVRIGTRICRASSSGDSNDVSTEVVGAEVKSPKELFGNLEFACKEVDRAPLSMKQELRGDIMTAFVDLNEADVVGKWGKEGDSLKRSTVFMGDLKLMGIKDPSKIATPTVRNDLSFIVAVVGSTSILAVAAGQLPGDWGFFVPYFTGGISLVVLAVGSTAPGLLSFFIDKFSRIFPDYRERVLRHEAAHFLIGYLMGVPIGGYSLDIGREHTDFAEGKLQRRLIAGLLEDSEIDTLAVVAMAGVAAEATVFEDVVGQTADLFDLQRILNRSSQKIPDGQQQNITRWAVYKAASLLRTYKEEYTQLMEAMQQGKSVAECVKAIEGLSI